MMTMMMMMMLMVVVLVVVVVVVGGGGGDVWIVQCIWSNKPPHCGPRIQVQLIVMPCSHAVCLPCYASSVRAKACAGRCLMCRKAG